MADAQKKSSGMPAAVASCAAVDCRHNEDKKCFADKIQVALRGGSPVCGTYAPRKPAARP